MDKDVKSLIEEKKKARNKLLIALSATLAAMVVTCAAMVHTGVDGFSSEPVSVHINGADSNKKETILAYGESIEKNPSVTNTGSGKGYAFLKITEPLINADSQKVGAFKFRSNAANTDKLTQADADDKVSVDFEYNNADWEFLRSIYKADTQTIEYLFGYKYILEPNSENSTLFDTMAFNDTVRPEDIDGSVYSDISAFAVQTAGDIGGFSENEFTESENKNALLLKLYEVTGR